MRANSPLTLAVLAILACGTSQREGAPGPARSETAQADTALKRADGSYVLSTVPATGDGRATYEVIIPSCGRDACAVRVRLLDGGVAYDSSSVDWESPIAAPQRTEQLAAVIGAGDPLQLGRTLPVWQTGDGETAVSTLVRQVPLRSGAYGLLVHQSAGAEHVKRLHYLFVANGRKLVLAWKGWEGQGPTTSAVDTMDVDGDGRDEILYWHFTAGERGSAWSLTVQRWNPSARRAEEVPAASGAPVYAVVAAPGIGADSAAGFLMAHASCLEGFRVLRDIEGAVAVAAVTARQSLAAEAEREARGCAGNARIVRPRSQVR